MILIDLRTYRTYMRNFELILVPIFIHRYIIMIINASSFILQRINTSEQ